MSAKQILIVEDDPDLQSLLRKRLERHGFHCTSAFSVEAALEKLGEGPDLVILDLGFKKTNGTAFLSVCKEPGEKTPPIIVLSGHTEQGVVDYVLDQGASRFLSKPVDPELLLSTVRDCMTEEHV